MITYLQKQFQMLTSLKDPAKMTSRDDGHVVVLLQILSLEEDGLGAGSLSCRTEN